MGSENEMVMAVEKVFSAVAEIEKMISTGKSGVPARS